MTEGFARPLPPAVDDPEAARSAGRDWLSLALIDARNRTLRWLAALEASPAGALQGIAGLPPALWLAGHAAWFADWWVLRHVHTGRGEAGDPSRPRLAPADADSDRCFHAERRGEAATLVLPPVPDVRAWMADVLEGQLELLSAARDDDEALYLHRLVLRHEDRTAERLAVLASHLDVTEAPWPDTPLRADPGPLALPAQTWVLGSAPGGAVPGPERWAHPVRLPAFEIDARPVSWGAYAEFVADGGYDEPRWWSPAGLAWLQRSGRRAPRRVAQIGGPQGGGVVAARRGRLQRVPPAAPVAHVTRHEAEAWCAWAGRRLPAEAEWEAAAVGAARRGFAWGEVLEWVAGTARAFPGHADPPGEFDTLPAPGANPPAAGVLRGASTLTPPRAAHPRARRFAPPDDDVLPTGFRSCAL